MRVGASSSAMLTQMWATQMAQTAQWVAAHQSGPTDRPVSAPDAVVESSGLRQPSRHTFDIRV